MGNSAVPLLPRGKIDVAKLNFMLSMIKGQKPKDEIEAMLLAKIAIFDEQVMKFAERLQAARTLR